MPIYEYECRKCGHRFEYLLLSSSPAAKCPACQKKDLKQLISAYAVSSESTRKSNLSSARKKAAVVQKDKQHEEHKQLHDHYDHH
jgi:putative FmdB family regulatory protein